VYDRNAGATPDHEAAFVVAAQNGDQAALDALVERHLPLLYNIVGRALDGNHDVDDVVQETLFRVVDRLRDLRDPAAFRSWMVAIAMRLVRDRFRSRQAQPAGFERSSDTQLDAADPGADFVDLTILRLALTDQRRETALATRWLDEDDRELLALWWLEAAGELTRADLVAALGLNAGHVSVRVQRDEGAAGDGQDGRSRDPGRAAVPGVRGAGTPLGRGAVVSLAQGLRTSRARLRDVRRPQGGLGAR
jgi:RNA polymerase sigma factor (sigma-70 family)